MLEGNMKEFEWDKREKVRKGRGEISALSDKRSESLGGNFFREVLKKKKKAVAVIISLYFFTWLGKDHSLLEIARCTL